MNNQLLANFLKGYSNSRRIWMAFFVFVLFPLYHHAQETSIIHYQKHEKINHIILPNDIYNPSLFDIFVPDSIYSAGKITIKHLQIKDFKVKAQFTFSINTFISVSYFVKKKNKVVFEAMVTDKTSTKLLPQQELEKVNITLETTTSSRKLIYTFKSMNK